MMMYLEFHDKESPNHPPSDSGDTWSQHINKMVMMYVHRTHLNKQAPTKLEIRFCNTIVKFKKRPPYLCVKQERSNLQASCTQWAKLHDFKGKLLYRQQRQPHANIYHSISEIQDDFLKNLHFEKKSTKVFLMEIFRILCKHSHSSLSYRMPFSE